MLSQGTSSVGDVPVAHERDFAAFFNDEYLRLFRALVLICGGRAEAEDVAQESFVRVFERWERVREMDSPTAYLYRIALNERRSRLRHAARWGRRSLVERGDVDDASRAAITRADVERSLRRLTAEQRAAVVLAEFVGLTSTEVGAVLGLNGPAVRARLTRARATLREELHTDE
jgi:RNA polymerase sigma factor (sigma-70 family)